jgi:hypothetical protein
LGHMVTAIFLPFFSAASRVLQGTTHRHPLLPAGHDKKNSMLLHTDCWSLSECRFLAKAA